jgi:hypothetical protein
MITKHSKCNVLQQITTKFGHIYTEHQNTSRHSSYPETPCVGWNSSCVCSFCDLFPELLATMAPVAHLAPLAPVAQLAPLVHLAPKVPLAALVPV